MCTTEPETWTDWAPWIASVAAPRIAFGRLAATPLSAAPPPPPHPAVVAASDAEIAKAALHTTARLRIPPTPYSSLTAWPPLLSLSIATRPAFAQEIFNRFPSLSYRSAIR
jgi:hypothetical protein